MMLKYIYTSCLLLLFIPSVQGQVLLDGKNATYKDLLAIAEGEEFTISEEALNKVKTSYELLLNSARNGAKIYGFTSGVGLNKDVDAVTVNGQFSEKVMQLSHRFNIDLIRAHSCSIGPALPNTTVRLMMAIRLKMLLSGADGVQKEVVDVLEFLLREEITPMVPSKGSVGEADITIMAHVALAMIGEGKVYYKGHLAPAKQVFATFDQRPLKPTAKDALGIFSSNTYSLAMAVKVLSEIEKIQRIRMPLYIASLEALNGNISPFSPAAITLKGYPPAKEVSRTLLSLLDTSYLNDYDPKRPLQDPLSFRNEIWYLSKMKEALDNAKKCLERQLNHSDHNPGIAITAQGNKEQNAVIPNANFEPVTWLMEFKTLSSLLKDASHNSAQRIFRLYDPKITGLTRYLKNGRSEHSFGAVEKTVAFLASENEFLAAASNVQVYSVAGGMEDVATNAPLFLSCLTEQIANHFYLMAIEGITVCQALDLRQDLTKVSYSKSTIAFKNSIRKSVSRLDADRPMTEDFESIYTVLSQ